MKNKQQQMINFNHNIVVCELIPSFAQIFIISNGCDGYYNFKPVFDFNSI